MTNSTKFRPDRSRAIREMLSDFATESAAAPHHTRTVVVTIALIAAALGVAGGGTALAMSGHLPFTPAPVVSNTTTPNPIERETPGVRSTPSPSPTEDSSATARGYARQACQALQSALNSDGNIISNDAWAAALANAHGGAVSAAGLDQSWAGLATSLTTLAQTPVPVASATDAEKNAYSDTYLPVATDCLSLDVELPTD